MYKGRVQQKADQTAHAEYLLVCVFLHACANIKFSRNMAKL